MQALPKKQEAAHQCETPRVGRGVCAVGDAHYAVEMQASVVLALSQNFDQNPAGIGSAVHIFGFCFYFLQQLRQLIAIMCQLLLLRCDIADLAA